MTHSPVKCISLRCCYCFDLNERMELEAVYETHYVEMQIKQALQDVSCLSSFTMKTTGGPKGKQEVQLQEGCSSQAQYDSSPDFVKNGFVILPDWEETQRRTVFCEI